MVYGFVRKLMYFDSKIQRKQKNINAMGEIFEDVTDIEQE
jgi:hypothetical protein